MKIAISDVIEKPISGEWGDDGGDIKVLRTTNFTNEGWLNLDEVVSRKIDIEKVKSKKLIPGDIIIEKSGGSPNQPVGRVVYFDESDTYLCNNFTAILRSKKELVFPRYLHYIMFCNHRFGITNNYQNKTTGIINLQLNRYLDSIHIPLPPLPTQQKIAAILDAADAYRQKTKALMEKYDQLAQSLFLDMFKKYLDKNEEELPIKKVAKFIDYRGKTPRRIKVGIPYISAKCVRIGYFDQSRIDFIDENTYEKIMTRGFPRTDDVLFTTEGATMGFTCRIPGSFEKFAVGQRLITLQVKENYNSTVLEYMLNHSLMQNRIFQKATGSAVKGIRSAEFGKLKIPFPPLSLQNQFADRIQWIEAQKQQAQAALTKAEELFSSLLQSAFKGELVE